MKKRICYIVIALVVLLFIFIFTKRDSEIQGCWVYKQDSIVVCFDFNGDDFAYVLSNGGCLEGKFELEDNYIICTDSDGNEFAYKYELNKDTLKITALSGSYTLKKYEKEVEKSNLKDYKWAAKNTSQEMIFEKDIVTVTNSVGEVTKMNYDLLGCNNVLLKLEYEDEFMICFIECSDEKLTVYDNSLFEPIEYYVE